MNVKNIFVCMYVSTYMCVCVCMYMYVYIYICVCACVCVHIRTYTHTHTHTQKTTILPVVLYGCKTCSLTLMEERRLRVFENRVLRGIFGPDRGEVTGEWRKLHNEELNDQYCSPSIVRAIKSRRMRWAWHVARMGEEMRLQGFGGEI